MFLEPKSQAIFLVLDKCKQKATLKKRILSTQRTYLLTQLNLKENEVVLTIQQKSRGVVHKFWYKVT